MTYQTYVNQRAALIEKLGKRGYSAPAKRFPKLAHTMRFDSGEIAAHTDQLAAMRELLRDMA